MLVGWFWVSRPFETVFQSISGRLPKKGRKRKERIDESKNVQTTPTRTYCKRSRPLPYCNLNCRTPRHWKFTQHHRTPTTPRGRKRRERIEESKNVQTTPPTRTYCKCNRPLPYYHPNCRTPRHWKLTQHHRTTRPPTILLCCRKR